MATIRDKEEFVMTNTNFWDYYTEEDMEKYNYDYMDIKRIIEEWNTIEEDIEYNEFDIDELIKLDPQTVIDFIKKFYSSVGYEQTAFFALLEFFGNYKDAIDYFFSEEYEFYADMNLSEVAEEFASEGLFGDVSDMLLPYIDFEKLGDDLRCDGYCLTDVGIIRIN